MTSEGPLFVDLDGTLIRTDMLVESAMVAARFEPLRLVSTVGSLLVGGRAKPKEQLSEIALGRIDPATLPYNEEVLAYVREERERGRHIVLATATHRRIAEQIAHHLGVFDGVIATEHENLRGAAKLRAIREYCEREGLGVSFEYIGDSEADVPLFEAASTFGIVGGKRLKTRSEGLVRRFGDGRGGVKSAIRLLRPHQWAKNVLIMVPVIAGQRLLDPEAVVSGLIAMVVLSLLASSVYIVNDLLDLSADRLHPRKRNRPLASGAVSIPIGFAMAVGLIVAGMGLAMVLTPWKFVLIAGLYLGVSTAYSLLLKRKLLVDVLCLAGLYTLRILAGGAVTGIVVSPWLLAFSMFVFLSLAFVKRYTELATVVEGSGSGGGPRKAVGRGYWEEDLDLIRSVGPAAGYVAVLVLALYVSVPEVSQHYSTPSYLFLLCPLVLYWLTRVWFLAHRRQLHDDPVVFALSDQNSRIVTVLCVGVMLAAKFL